MDDCAAHENRFSVHPHAMRMTSSCSIRHRIRWRPRHPLDQLSASDPIGKAGIVCHGNSQRLASSVMDDPHVTAVPGEIGRCGEAGRSGTDDNILRLPGPYQADIGRFVSAITPVKRGRAFNRRKGAAMGKRIGSVRTSRSLSWWPARFAPRRMAVAQETTTH